MESTTTGLVKATCKNYIKAIFRPCFSVCLRFLFVGLSLWLCLEFEADVAVRLEHQIRFKRPAALGDEVRYKIRLAVLK